MIVIPEIKQIHQAGRRFYTDGNFKYPSVTTVLGAFEDLSAWRDRVGHEEANRIGRKAALRGTKFHSQVEHYLKEESMPVFRTPLEYQLFINTRPILNKITDISLIETRLFSHHLRLAGTVDCIAKFDGKLSVIDFKTSTRPKSESYIDNYFQQASAYSIMYEELTMIPIPNLVIIVAVEGAPSQVFISKRDKHAKELISKRDRYEEYINNENKDISVDFVV